MQKSIFCLLFCLVCITLSAQKNLPDPEGLHGTHPSDCSRATPIDIIDASVFPDTKFVLAKDSLNGYDWVDFKNGDKLLLINCGCDDYTLIFQFTTSNFSGDTTDCKYWYPVAVKLMKEVVNGIDKSVPINIQTGIDTLEKFTQKYPDSLKLHHIIYYNYDKNPPDDITSDPNRYIDYMNMFSHLFINRIQKLPGKEYELDIYFTVNLSED